MTCPDIYLGASYAASPPTPFWINPAIQPPPTITQGVGITIPVTARNNGTDDAPPTLLELYWSDPTTGFQALPARLIGESVFDTILGQIPFPAPATDGEATHTFAWTPGSDAATTNSGHVCLLARLSMQAPPLGAGCMQQLYTGTPATDKRSGIRNIHIVIPPPPPPAGGGRGGAGGAGKGDFMSFAFAATNTFRDIDDTKLSVRALDPKQDRERLQALVADPMVNRVLSHRGVKFAAPAAIRAGLGRERVRAPSRKRGDPCAPRLSRAGALFADEPELLLAPNGKFIEDCRKPLDLRLLPDEIQQTIVQVRPAAQKNAVYVVDIEHTGPKGRLIGGLTIVFVPPHDYF